MSRNASSSGCARTSRRLSRSFVLSARRMDALGRSDHEHSDYEQQIRPRVDRERRRNAERPHRDRREHRPDRTREVERHRVERDRGSELLARDEIADQRHRSRCVERAHRPEREREQNHDPHARKPSPRERGERARQRRRDELGHQQQPSPVVPVGGASRPRRQYEDRDEVAEVEDSEQECRVVGQPVDEKRRCEILEPGPARRGCIADEVRTEVPIADQPQGGGRPGRGHRLGPPGLVQLGVDLARHLRGNARDPLELLR